MSDDGPDVCPCCGEEYIRKVSLSSRMGKTIDVEDAGKLCQDAVRRTSGGPVAGHKSTRSDSERYRFVGYLHEAQDAEASWTVRANWSDFDSVGPVTAQQLEQKYDEPVDFVLECYEENAEPGEKKLHYFLETRRLYDVDGIGSAKAGQIVDHMIRANMDVYE